MCNCALLPNRHVGLTFPPIMLEEKKENKKGETEKDRRGTENHRASYETTKNKIEGSKNERR